MAGEFSGLDFSRLLAASEEKSLLEPLAQRAAARLVPFHPWTPEDRMAGFAKIGYRPQGLFVPEDLEMAADLRGMIAAAGALPEVDARLSRYWEIQDITEQWERDGVAGKWRGQQALARSPAVFRLAAWGRRSGKTFHAAREVVVVALFRPRSVSWLCGFTLDIADRCFQMVKQLLIDLGIPMVTLRDTSQEKLIILENNSTIKGVSLKNVDTEAHKSGTAVGMAVDFAVLDEAAHVVSAAWTRTIMPPLLDRDGRALLLSSWEGEDEFFYKTAMEAKSSAVLDGRVPDWEVSQEASYDINFHNFPQGRKTESLQRAERTTNPVDFLEQYGGIPAGLRGRVYPQFKRSVHVGSYPWVEDYPVKVAIDPSFGSNPYAVIAFQDWKTHLTIFDEIYETNITAEEVSEEIRRRPWSANIDDMIMDSARPMEVQRWIALNWPVFGVPDKPEIPERLPLHRNWLRDPRLFWPLYRSLVNGILDLDGLAEDADLEMEEDDQKVLLLRVEERLADDNLTPELLGELRKCSRIFVDRSCYWTIEEHLHYAYPRNAKKNRNNVELPSDWSNHIMDALGYYLWHYKRFETFDDLPGESYSRLQVVGRRDVVMRYDEGNMEVDVVQPRSRSWLTQIRGYVRPENQQLKPKNNLMVVRRA